MGLTALKSYRTEETGLLWVPQGFNSLSSKVAFLEDSATALPPGNGLQGPIPFLF